MSDIITLSSGESAAMDPVAPGFAYGFGLFETMKLAEGGLCFWGQHWQRLQQSADVLGFDFSYSEDAVLAAIRRVAADDSLSSGTIKLSLFSKKLYVYSRPALMSFDGAKQLQLDTACPINERSRLAGHKTHNYMENFLLLQACRKRGFFDVLRVNTSGFLGETTVGNVFFIREDQLCTPSLQAGILPGVVRAAILDVARSVDVNTEEGLYAADVLGAAQAVFMTNSSAGIIPVEKVGQAFTGESAAHPMLTDLSRALADFEKTHSILL